MAPGTEGHGRIPISPASAAARATTPILNSRLLALHEAERAQVSASDQTWRLAEAYWKRCQNDDGSWGYNQQNHNFNGSGSMTCAGITSLVIALDRVQPPDARVVGDRIECCVPRKTGGADDVDRIERGIQWLGQALLRQPPIPAPAARCSTTSTASSASAGSPRGGSFPCLPGRARPTGPTGIAKGADYLVRQQDICRVSGRAQRPRRKPSR